MRRGLTTVPVYRHGDDRSKPAKYSTSPEVADRFVAAGLAISIKGWAIAVLKTPQSVTLGWFPDVSARMNGRDMENFAMGQRKVTDVMNHWHETACG